MERQLRLGNGLTPNKVRGCAAREQHEGFRRFENCGVRRWITKTSVKEVLVAAI